MGKSERKGALAEQKAVLVLDAHGHSVDSSWCIPRGWISLRTTGAESSGLHKYSELTCLNLHNKLNDLFGEKRLSKFFLIQNEHLKSVLKSHSNKQRDKTTPSGDMQM